MKLQYRIDLLSRLNQYILSNDPDWQNTKQKAFIANAWFIPEFIQLACDNISRFYLDRDLLINWCEKYEIKEDQEDPKRIGIVMAGNIPLVGFHDFLSVFISGHKAIIKPSSKDEILIRHLVEKLWEWDDKTKDLVVFSPMLKGCDAYIATGSNNTSRYFQYYFGKYPNIIRRNRSSIAILDGTEPIEELEKLADDVFQFFGLGCRNVTKILVPSGYDFIPILEAFRKYQQLLENHNKYKNNYDYNLAMHILNKIYYMTNGTILLIEDQRVFSPISQLNYEFYENEKDLEAKTGPKEDIQCIVGRNSIPFGKAQQPTLGDYADGVDTLDFLTRL